MPRHDVPMAPPGLPDTLGERGLSTGSAREPDTVRAWTRSATRTRPAPASGRPSWPAGARSCAAFDVVLERVAHGRPERSIVLTGLRGVGKTVLLNALRSAAVRRGWGTGKLEARPDQGLRRPLSSALHQAVRELGHPDEDSVTHVLGVVRSFAERDAGHGRQAPRPLAPRHRRAGRPRPGRLRRHRDRPGRAVHRPRRARGRPGPGHRGLRRRDAGPRSRRRLRAVRRLPRDQPVGTAGDRRRRRAAAPARRCCRPRSPTPSGSSATSASTGSTARTPTSRCASRPRPRRRRTTRRRWPRCTPPPAATPTSSRPTARPSGTSRRARRSRADGRRRGGAGGRARAGRRLLRLALRAGDAGGAGVPPRHGRRRIGLPTRRGSTSRVVRPPTSPAVLGKKPQSLSPARDALLKKGLIYSGERGRIAFTVPHFGAFLRSR